MPQNNRPMPPPTATGTALSRRISNYDPAEVVSQMIKFCNTPDGDGEVIARLEAIESQLSELNRKLDLIFGNNVLINGKFQEIKL